MQPIAHFSSAKNNKSLRILVPSILAAISAFLLAACGLKVGDVKSVNEANEMAINCETDQALAAVDRASQSEGIGAALGDLDRVAILRDAGRIQEAEAAMAERNKRWNAAAENMAKAEEAVKETVKKIRDEREKRTGKRTCD
ncbi:MAG: hypothetical protein WAU34_04295 [Desulfobacterales bacterium]|jgi:hypothetical protein